MFFNQHQGRAITGNVIRRIENMKPLLEGMLTGLFLQLALGPVFFYILGITIDSNYLNTLSAVLAVTLADYIYIVLSLLGIGRMLQKDRIKIIFAMFSAVVLVVFGMMLLYKGIIFIDGAEKISPNIWTPLNSFVSCFVLTLSSPLTIVFWSSIFSAKAMEKNYQEKELIIFGAGTGASTFIFLSVTMLCLSFIKTGIPAPVVQILNCTVGLVLICYGVARSLKTVKSRILV